jgi:hypothetical protein
VSMLDDIVPPRTTRSRILMAGTVVAITLTVLVAIVVISAIGGGTTSTKSTAASYIKANGSDLFTVENSISTLARQLRSNDVTGIARTAVGAHRVISNVVNDLQNYTGSWSGSPDASHVIDATQSLASVTGAIVTWTNTPTEAGLASEIAGAWAADSAEWNATVNAVWRAAHEKSPPTFS